MMSLKRQKLMDPGSLEEDPTPGDILHVSEDDGDRLQGALVNIYGRKLVKVKTFNLYKFTNPHHLRHQT